jgi:dehydro coenzyme F420 reductase / coenzyme F420-0:L-glutamate ligase / coenzyme F420-1:gamma-L-glutamate ligase
LTSSAEPDPQGVLALMRRRRTARAHSGDAPSEETVALLLEAIRWAPSAANRQPWELILIERYDLKQRVRELFVADSEGRDERYRAVTERQADLLLAPVLVAVCGDTATKESFVNAPALGSEVQEELFTLSMGAAIQNFLLMATACNLTSTWLARPARAPGVTELLEVPSSLRVVALVAIGTGEQPRSSGHRLPIAPKTHRDVFGG